MPHVRRLLALALIALSVASCGFMRLQGQGSDRVEVFNFVTKPGAGGGNAVERKLLGLIEPNELLRGSALHVANVESPAGSADFYTWRELDSEGRRVECLGQFESDGASWGCGGSNPQVEDLAVIGETGGDNWRSAILLTGPETDTVVAVADDATEYTIVPGNGYGYVAWPAVRGGLTLSALNEDGDVVSIVDLDQSLEGP